MNSYSIKEATDKYTYVVFENEDGKSIGQMFNGSPDEAEIMVKGAELLPETKEPSLDALKEVKRNEINFWREVALKGTFAWKGHSVDCDDQDRANIIGEALAAQMGEPFPPGYVWRMADNSSVPMTAADVADMARTLRSFTLGLYQQSWARKAAVDAARSTKELDSILVK